jgi:ribosomal protein S18 acetylase RimI-like enzyme
MEQPMSSDTRQIDPAADLVIRAADEADMVDIHRMAVALAAFHGEDCALTLDALCRDALGERPWISLFVAELSGNRVAYAAFNPLIRLATGQRGMEMQHLYVEAGMRGRGVGTRLLHVGIDFARSRGCSYLALGARDDNPEAQAFYRARGFQILPQKNTRFILSI